MKPKTKSTADYEDLATTYQVVQIALLNSILKANGIADKRKRRKICEDFIFDEGVILDEGAFQTERGGKWYAPVLAFTDAPGDPDEGFTRAKKLCTVASDFAGYHEYAFGNVDYFFNESKEETPFDWGPEHE
jgi:hypothetical protein